MGNVGESWQRGWQQLSRLLGKATLEAKVAVGVGALAIAGAAGTGVALSGGSQSLPTYHNAALPNTSDGPGGSTAADGGASSASTPGSSATTGGSSGLAGGSSSGGSGGSGSSGGSGGSAPAVLDTGSGSSTNETMNATSTSTTESTTTTTAPPVGGSGCFTFTKTNYTLGPITIANATITTCLTGGLSLQVTGSGISGTIGSITLQGGDGSVTYQAPTGGTATLALQASAVVATQGTTVDAALDVSGPFSLKPIAFDLKGTLKASMTGGPAVDTTIEVSFGNGPPTVSVNGTVTVASLTIPVTGVVTAGGPGGFTLDLEVHGPVDLGKGLSLTSASLISQADGSFELKGALGLPLGGTATLSGPIAVNGGKPSFDLTLAASETIPLVNGQVALSMEVKGAIGQTINISGQLQLLGNSFPYTGTLVDNSGTWVLNLSAGQGSSSTFTLNVTADTATKVVTVTGSLSSITLPLGGVQLTDVTLNIDADLSAQTATIKLSGGVFGLTVSATANVSFVGGQFKIVSWQFSL